MNFTKTKQHIKTALLLVGLLTAESTSLLAQTAARLEWQYFGAEQGVGMTFETILQDRQGFIWLGSSNGLYRYDGYRIQSYKKYSNQPRGLSSDSVQDLQEDAQGDIWIATFDGGIARWERSSGRFFHFMHDPADPNSLSSNNVKNILIDQAGDIWALVRLPENIMVLDRLVRATGQVVHYRHVPDDPRSLSCDTISIPSPQALGLRPLYLDPDGRVWVGTANGLNRYDRASDGFQRFLHHAHHPNTLSFPQVLTVEASPREKDIYWVRSASPGLERIALDRLNARTGVVDRVALSGEGTSDCVGLYWPKNEDAVWMSDRALVRFQGNFPFAGPKRIDLERSSNMPGLRTGIFGCRNGSLLLPLLGRISLTGLRGLDERLVADGIFYLDPNDERPVFFSQNPTDPTQPFGEVNSLLEDRSGIIWIGLSGGFYKLKIADRERPSKPLFENYPQARDGAPGLFSTNVRAVYEESPSVFWLGTYGGGLARLDRSTGQIIHFLHQASNPHSLGNDIIYTLCQEPQKNRLWIGHQEGLDVLELESIATDRPAAARFRHVSHPSGLLNDRINEIYPDGTGKLWIGTTRKGLFRFDPATEQVEAPIIFTEPNPDPSHSTNINKVYIDSRDQTWVAPGMGGLCRLWEENGSYQYECFLDGFHIADFFEAFDGLLWCAAMNYGLVKFDRQTGHFELINMENRLTRNSVMGIEEDQLGRIWFTSVGLTRYDPEADTYRIYGRDAGILGVDPNRGFFKSKAGELFYSAPYSALQIFTPEKVQDNPVAPQVVLTGFKLFNEYVPVGPDSPLKVSIEVAREIHLAHHQHSFSLEFAGLEFTDPARNQYRYRLLDIDPDWVYAGANREARYNTVRPGKYVFQVAAANSDGVWSEEPATVQIFIALPWWRRWWAYLLFAILIITPAAWLYQYDVKRKLALAETKRVREVDALKTRLYTNITHEFRTPLTVILGMAEQIAEKPERWLNEGLTMILRNGRQLLELVNQMLDLRKIEAGAMQLNKRLGDVLPYLKYVSESFHSLAESKGIELHFSTPLDELTMDYDPDSLLRILSNLLSNAVKFTPPGGQASVMIRQIMGRNGEWLEISVSDTGIGIPSDQQSKIFNRFYQVDDSATRKGEGTGIGLALTQDLVRLLGGEIHLQSEPGRGSEFRVQLPITRSAPPGETPEKILLNGVVRDLSVLHPEIPQEDVPAQDGDNENPLALIIEDNKDVVHYLRSCLEANYRLIAAYNGRSGIEMALEQVPDIIISDVMMPEQDGFEVTDSLKNDERTSHIPIILLTARATVEDRIAGLKRGADAYLAKPFNQVELMVVMNNLIEVRNHLRERYAGSTPQPLTTDPALQIEDAFVRKVREVVEARLDDPDFGVEALSKAIFLGPTQVHRKLKALTGLATGHFIRNIRMQHALHLLRTTDRKIAEIAMDVGFNDPSYFSRIFTEHFGQPPSEMRRMQL